MESTSQGRLAPVQVPEIGRKQDGKIDGDDRHDVLQQDDERVLGRLVEEEAGQELAALSTAAPAPFVIQGLAAVVQLRLRLMAKYGGGAVRQLVTYG